MATPVKKSIIRKLIEIQQEIKVGKEQDNTFGGFSYRSCEDILKKLKPLLRKQGCFVDLSDEIVQIGDRFYVKALATIGDENGTRSTIAYAREAEHRVKMDDAQLTGSSSSYARKYALAGLLGLDDNKDADTRDNTNVGVKKPFKPYPRADYGTNKDIEIRETY